MGPNSWMVYLVENHHQTMDDGGSPRNIFKWTSWIAWHFNHRVPQGGRFEYEPSTVKQCQTWGGSMGIFEVIWSYLRLLYVTIVLIVLILWKLYRLYHLIWHIIYWTMEALLRWLQKVGWTIMDPRKKAFPDFVTWSLTNFLEGRPEKLLEYKHQHGLNWIWLDDVGCIHDVFCVKAGA